MIWQRQEKNRDLFWAGFLTGAFVGGTLGILILSEVGQQTRKRIERAADQVRSRFNGRPESGEPEKEKPEPGGQTVDMPETGKDVEEPTS